MSLTTCVLPSGFFLTPLFICLEITKITIMCIDALNGKLEYGHSLCGCTTLGMVHLCASFFTAGIIKTFVTLTECLENGVSVYIVL